MVLLLQFLEVCDDDVVVVVVDGCDDDDDESLVDVVGLNASQRLISFLFFVSSFFIIFFSFL